MGLPVVHILEEDVKEQVDPGVYDEQVGLLEMTLDVESGAGGRPEVSRALISAPPRLPPPP